MNSPASPSTQSMPPTDQWLIRTAQNWIAGPYPKERVRQMILEGKLTLQDEICSANGYWIFLHEREEVKQLLGVEPPRVLLRPGEEITATPILATVSIQYDEDVTDPELEYPQSHSSKAADAAGRKALLESSSENTAVIHTDALKDFQNTQNAQNSKKKSAKKAPGETPGSNGTAASLGATPTTLQSPPSSGAKPALIEIKGQGQVTEGHTFWRAFAWFLVLFAAGLIAAIFRLLKQ